MKLLLGVCLVFPFISFAQNIQIDSCGLNNDSRLTKYEVDYFNEALDNQCCDSLELASCRILFLSGNLGFQASSKQHFFQSSGKPWFDQDDYPSMELIVLRSDERMLLPEYDAVLVTWSKIKCTEKMRKRFIANAIKNASRTENQPTE